MQLRGAQGRRVTEAVLMSLSSGGVSPEMVTAAAAAGAAAATQGTNLCLRQQTGLRLRIKQTPPMRPSKQPLQQRPLGCPALCSLATSHLPLLPGSSCHLLNNRVWSLACLLLHRSLQWHCSSTWAKPAVLEPHWAFHCRLMQLQPLDCWSLIWGQQQQKQQHRAAQVGSRGQPWQQQQGRQNQLLLLRLLLQSGLPRALLRTLQH